MRTISSLLLVLASLAPLAAQDDGAKYGFIRLVNAVAAGEGKVTLLLDGADLYPSGYQLGDATGGMGVEAGRCKVVVQRDGAKDGTTTIQVEEGKTTTIIPFAELIPATDDEPEHWQIRILRLKQKAESERRNATFVSVARDDAVPVEMRDPDGTWKKYQVKRFDTTVAPMNYPEGYVPLRMKGRELPSIPVLDIGNYVVVLYNDADGEVQALNFRDFHHVTAD
ncbi:hypothetical protein [Haloferula sp. A504]|uniref:hypothetical protein n=1 Tax=Haloferula sp. A504 TaxID=3373601 RepID=UPI0031C46131|nr:hypothetical protein [Verrucomicrobiaceae bacterium E54]